MSFKILFSKNPSEDYKTMDDEHHHHHRQEAASSSIGVIGDLPTLMMTSSEVATVPAPPPPYEEQAPSLMSKPSTSSMVIVNSNGSGGSLGSSSVSLSGQLSPASSTSQVADELNALQRAQLHLYKRLQQVKTQTYASLVVVLLLAGVILLFIANYHQANSQQGVSALNHHQGASSELKALVSNVASNDPESNKRIGKALSASLAHISSSLAQGNSVDENLVKNTIDKHLTQLFQDQHQRHDHNLDPNQAFRTAALESGVVNSIAAAVQQAGQQQHHTSDDGETILTELKAKQLAVIDGATADTFETTTVMAITTTGATISTLNNHHQTFNISIVVHSATVPSMDYMLMGRASDTFCEVFIDDVLVGSTSVIDNSNNPNWQYLFPKPFTVRRESTIRIDLQDMDHLKRDHIGGVLVVFGDLLNTDRLNKPIKLFHGKGDIWVTIKLA